MCAAAPSLPDADPRMHFQDDRLPRETMANNTLRDTLGALSSGTKAPSSSRSKQRKESQPDSDLQSAIEPLASSRSLGVDPRYKRQHVTRACDSCRRRKIKVCNIRREEDVARSAGPHVCTTDVGGTKLDELATNMYSVTAKIPARPAFVSPSPVGSR